MSDETPAQYERRLASRPRHTCDAGRAVGWFVPIPHDYPRELVNDDGWQLEYRDFYGFAIPVSFCPFCGARLETP